MAPAWLQHPPAPPSRDRPRVGRPLRQPAPLGQRPRCSHSRASAPTPRARSEASRSGNGRPSSIPTWRASSSGSSSTGVTRKRMRCANTCGPCRRSCCRENASSTSTRRSWTLAPRSVLRGSPDVRPVRWRRCAGPTRPQARSDSHGYPRHGCRRRRPRRHRPVPCDAPTARRASGRNVGIPGRQDRFQTKPTSRRFGASCWKNLESKPKLAGAYTEQSTPTPTERSNCASTSVTSRARLGRRWVRKCAGCPGPSSGRSSFHPLTRN